MSTETEMAAEGKEAVGRDKNSEKGKNSEKRNDSGGRSGISIILKFLAEKKIAVILYFTTVLLFVAACGLYHMENMNILLYAALLTSALWAGAGMICGLRYLQRYRVLEMAEKGFEQSKELAWSEICAETAVEEEPRTMEQQVIRLLAMVDEAGRRERSDWENMESERMDYFLMWIHQVKTPIAALRLLLEEAGDCRNNFRMREELFKIEQYAEMALTIQRLESMASDLELQEYELTPLLKQAVRKYSVLFINKGLQVEVPELECRVLTDEKWFSFCLEQILSNSIKYTEKGKITMRIMERCSADGPGAEEFPGDALDEISREGDCVLLSIEDTGIGIRAEDLPRIFDRGFTGYNGRVDKRATGIGLYLCKRICRQLGIRIIAESRIGEGTRMKLMIPASCSRPAFS